MLLFAGGLSVERREGLVSFELSFEYGPGLTGLTPSFRYSRFGLKDSLGAGCFRVASRPPCLFFNISPRFV